MKEVLKNRLICPQCGFILLDEDDEFTCNDCHINYQLSEGTLFFSRAENSFFAKEESSNVINKFKHFFKKYPFFFRIISGYLGAFFVGKSTKNILKKIPKRSLILNLGSGPKIIREDIVNIDSHPFVGVDIVADIKCLPILNNSTDLVICETVLEHIDEPEAVINEIYRILKPGGVVYITVPFIFGFHSCPEDYYRWTESGLREKMKRFCRPEIGVCVGPTSALVFIFSEWLAIVLSFGFKRLSELLFVFFLVVLAPLKLIDFLCFRYAQSKNIAAGFYYIGYKM